MVRSRVVPADGPPQRRQQQPPGEADDDPIIGGAAIRGWRPRPQRPPQRGVFIRGAQRPGHTRGDDTRQRRAGAAPDPQDGLQRHRHDHALPPRLRVHPDGLPERPVGPHNLLHLPPHGAVRRGGRRPRLRRGVEPRPAEEPRVALPHPREPPRHHREPGGHQRHQPHEELPASRCFERWRHQDLPRGLQRQEKVAVRVGQGAAIVV
mmetsp:Transcript_16792/g.33949  ORF Transcript_16792/g.33949 Transcript_16792/m.33949 type:complete len:207 (+) Transcript_16792:114-734(+)